MIYDNIIIKGGVHMRWLVWYIRSAFCKHDWKIEEYPYEKCMGNEIVETGFKVSATCKKCGWHRRYRKF
jgi:RNase P subunit RPR2